MKLRKLVSCIALLTITLCSLSTVTNASAEGTNDSLQTTDSTYHPNDYKELNHMLQKSVTDYHIPGLSVMIVDPTHTLYEGTFGNCKSVDTPFLIGSLSKSFTAVAIMQLQEQGKVDLYAPISDYINAGDYLKHAEDGDRITVKQLLNQTGGLGTYQRLTTAEITDTYDQHNYANVNYDILGKIIESVSGQTYESYVNEHIFTPLSMTHSAASLKKSKETGLIDSYRNFFGFDVAGEPDYPKKGSWSTTAAGYISSSASDMGRYLQMYLNDGQYLAAVDDQPVKDVSSSENSVSTHNLLSSDSIHSMFYDSIYVDSDSPYFYGMGWTVSVDYNEPLISHGGLVENSMAYMVILPERQTAYIILINANDYLVRDALMDKVSNNITAYLMGSEMTETNPSTYWVQHGIIDGIYLLLLAVAVLPLLRIRKHWKNHLADKKTKRIWRLIGNLFLHLVLPTLLLFAPSLTGNPLWVVWLFVKDLCIVLVSSAILLYIGGIVKSVLVWRQQFGKAHLTNIAK